MKKVVWTGIVATAALMLLPGSVFAQASDNAAINVTVNVAARAKLTLGSAAITFADADPDSVGTLSSGAITVDVKARTSAAGSVTLTVQASDDLKTSGSEVIAISGLTWTATGTNFVAGTSNKTTAQTVGSWTGPGDRSGTQTYSLPNSWSYGAGSYSATLNYTLSAP
jgi:hypothetical protein